MLWKKKDVSHVYVLSHPAANTTQLVDSQWSAIFFWNADGSTPIDIQIQPPAQADPPPGLPGPAPPIPPMNDPPEPDITGHQDEPMEPDVPMDEPAVPPNDPPDFPQQGGQPIPLPQNPPPDFPDDDMDQPPVRFHCYHQDLHVSPDAIVIPPNIPDEVMVHSQKRPFDGHDPGSKSKARPSQMPTSVVPVPPSSQPSNHLGGDATPPNQISNPQPESIQTSPQGIKRKSDKHGPEDEEDDDDLHDPTATSSGLHDTEPEPYHGPPILPYEDAENDPVVEQNESDNTVPYEDSTDTDQTQDYSDLYVDESQWSFLTQEQKLCSNTGSFTVPRLIDGTPVQVGKVQSMNPHMSFTTGITVQQRQARRKTKSDIMEEYYNLTEEDKAFMTLYSVENASSLLVGKKRKEATEQEKRELAKQFLEAKKAECQSWLDNEVFDLVDMRKLRIRNFVSGRWVLTTKRDKDGNFVKCKARWVLKGFQDKQKNDQETDSPAASRNGFRCATQHAANQGWNFFHMDLKTAFLQGEHYDESRDILCQIPPEYGYPPYMGARMKKPAYGLNDAPRKWWNVVDKALLSYGLVPTRADRCTYVLYGDTSKTKSSSARQSSSTGITVTLEQAGFSEQLSRSLSAWFCLPPC